MSVFEMVKFAVETLNYGEGGTVKEIFEFVRMNNSVPMTDQQLKCSIKQALDDGSCTGCFGRNTATKRYYVSCPPNCRPPPC